MRATGTPPKKSAVEADMLEIGGLRLFCENSYGTLIDPRLNVINTKTGTKEEIDESYT